MSATMQAFINADISGSSAGRVRSKHNSYSLLLGTLAGNFLIIVLVGAVLVVSGAAAWMGVGCGIMCDDYPDDWWSSLWLSWGLFFDPGTQTGISTMESGDRQFIVILFSFLGFVLNLIFLGLIVESCRTLLDGWRQLYGRIVCNGHTLVLGWTDKTLFLLGELAEMMTDSTAGGGTIVVLGELDEIEMRMEVNVAFPQWRTKWRKVSIRFCNGKPYEVDDLAKVSVYSAARVIVLGCSRLPRVADSQMLTTICAIKSMPEDQSLSVSTKICAELRQQQSLPVVLHLGGNPKRKNALQILPVGAKEAVNSILVMSSLDSSAGTALLDLMNFQGEQIEQVASHEFLPADGRVVTFGMLRTTFGKALPLGLVRKDGIALAPNDSVRIEADDFLLVVADDAISALREANRAARPAPVTLPVQEGPDSLEATGCHATAGSGGRWCGRARC